MRLLLMTAPGVKFSIGDSEVNMTPEVSREVSHEEYAALLQNPLFSDMITSGAIVCEDEVDSDPVAGDHAAPPAVTNGNARPRPRKRRG